jgi:hypothetical protein
MSSEKVAKDEKNISVWGAPDEKVFTYIDKVFYANKRGKNGEKDERTKKTKRIKVLSGYGDITYLEWCKRERKSGTEIITRESDGFIALARVR